MPRICYGLVLASMLLISGCCSAPRDETPPATTADSPAAEVKPEEAWDRDLRVYDIRDLLAPVTSFEAPPFDPTGRDPQPALIQPEADGETQVTRAEVIEQYITLITETVGSLEHWEDGDGSVRELNGNLIVKTNAENHAEIERLFAALRESSQKVMLTETRLLLIPEPRLRELFAEAGLTALDLDAPQAQTTRLIDEPIHQLLVEGTLADRHSITQTSPRVATHDGQTAYVQTHQQHAYVSDAEPSDGEGNESGVDVTVSVAESGATLIVRGTFEGANDLLSVELEPRLSNVAPPPFPVVRTITSLDGKGTATLEAPRVWSWRSVARFDDLPSGSTVMFVGDRLVGPAPGLLFRDVDEVPADLARRPVVLVQLKVVSVENDEPSLFPEIDSQLRSLSQTQDMTVPVGHAEQ